MALSINTNAAALNAYRDLSAATAPADRALAPAAGQRGSRSASGADSTDFSHANAAAATSAQTISDPDLAAQITLLAAAHISSNSMAALAAQANSSAGSVLALLR